MSTGRTLEHWLRFYSDGYDLSGYARKLGDLKWEYEVQPDAAWTDAVKNIIAPGPVSLGVGTLNVFLDNTAVLGPHIHHVGGGVKRVVMVAKGIRAAPAQGDPVYCAELEQLGYQAAVDGGRAVASIPFGEADAVAAHLAYSKPWGILLHAKAAATEANTAVGVDDNGGASAKGGFLCFQLFAVTGEGTVALNVQDAETNENAGFADLAGATSGALAHTAVPCAGIVALGATADVRQYLRWQIALTDITSATFALAFVRGN